MNFKLKVLAASVAMLALGSVSANAAVSGAANGASGNSTLIFSAWDLSESSDKGYSLDLGKLFTDMVGADLGSAGNPTIDSGTAWSGFTKQKIALTNFTGYDLANTQWTLSAADNSGRKRIITTINQTGYVDPIKSGVIGSAAGNFDNYIANGAAVAVGIETTSTSADEWSPVTFADGFGTGALSGLTSTIGYPSAAGMYVFWQESTSNAQTLGGVARMTNAAGVGLTSYLTRELVGGVTTTYLNIAAVPEVDTSGMMLAGLGLMGFIARRRRSAQA